MSTCWFCGLREAEGGATYHCRLYYVTGDAFAPRAGRGGGVKRYLVAKTLHLPIPRCPSCARQEWWIRTADSSVPMMTMAAVGGLIAWLTSRPGLMESNGAVMLLPLMLLAWLLLGLPWGIRRILYLVRRDLGWPEIADNPKVMRWLDAFWMIGEVGDESGGEVPVVEVTTGGDKLRAALTAPLVYPVVWAWRNLNGRRGSAEYAPAWTPLAGLPAGEALHGKPRLWERPGMREGEEIVGPDGGAMVWVPPGEFDMGSEKVFHSTPVHRVRLTKGFWMGKAPVTERQYEAFCRAATARSMGPRDLDGEGPVTGVDWVDAQAYCLWHSMTLPTEAQWEHAARGPVKMAEGVGQWCGDWSAKYEADEAVDPIGPEDGKGRVIRGRASDGKAGDDGRVVRGSGDPLQRAEDVGFRCVAGL